MTTPTTTNTDVVPAPAPVDFGQLLPDPHQTRSSDDYPLRLLAADLPIGQAARPKPVIIGADGMWHATICTSDPDGTTQTRPLADLPNADRWHRSCRNYMPYTVPAADGYRRLANLQRQLLQLHDQTSRQQLQFHQLGTIRHHLQQVRRRLNNSQYGTNLNVHHQIRTLTEQLQHSHQQLACHWRTHHQQNIHDLLTLPHHPPAPPTDIRGLGNRWQDGYTILWHLWRTNVPTLGRTAAAQLLKDKTKHHSVLTGPTSSPADNRWHAPHPNETAEHHPDVQATVRQLVAGWQTELDATQHGTATHPGRILGAVTDSNIGLATLASILPSASADTTFDKTVTLLHVPHVLVDPIVDGDAARMLFDNTSSQPFDVSTAPPHCTDELLQTTATLAAGLLNDRHTAGQWTSNQPDNHLRTALKTADAALQPTT